MVCKLTVQVTISKVFSYIVYIPVADARTCLLHPASHTHRQLSDEQLKEAGVDKDLIRFSIGLEDPQDIIDDIRQALIASEA